MAAAVAKGCTVNETDQEGNSCLHIAAAKGSNAILRILLNAGAKVSAKNEAGYTSVELAVEQKHEATVEVLLEAIVAAGMDIDARYEEEEEEEEEQESKPFRISDHPHVLNYSDDLGGHTCDLCHESIEDNGYRCSRGCDFDMCMKCACNKPLKVFNHPHVLNHGEDLSGHTCDLCHK